VSDLCPHDDDPATCPPCLHARRPDLTAPPAEETVAWMTVAKYTGHCPACNLPINIGDWIAKWADGVIRHDSCKP